MILAFQILLFVLIVFFGLATIGEKDWEYQLHFTCVTIAAILAMCFTFWVG